MENNIRICKICKKSKVYLLEMRKYRHICKQCEIQDRLAYQKSHKEQTYKNTREWRSKNRSWQKNRDLQRYHGIFLGDYQFLFMHQNGVCAICHKNINRFPNLAVDHDHLTGKIRGLLCSECNFGLGKFKDSPELLDAAKLYLERNKCDASIAV